MFFLFYDISKTFYFNVFYFRPLPLWSYVHIMMLILLFVWRSSNSLSFLDLPQKLSIVLWHLPPIRYSLVMLVTWYIWVFPFLVSLLYIVTTRVLFILYTSLPFMKGENILRLIVTLLVITFSMTFFLCLLFLFLYRLQTCLSSCTHFRGFSFWVVNS